MYRGERLTPRQERDLIVGAEAGDPDACRTLTEAFLPAIAGLARRFPGGIGVERRELIQEGVAGLLFAARRYDTALSTPFWAYASFWVRKSMQELVAEITRPVALSDRAVRGLAQLRAARSEHVRMYGAEPSDEELRSATGLSRAQLESLQVLERMPRGIEEHLGPDDDPATIGDTIVDPFAEEAYEHVLDTIEVRQVHAVAELLDERARTVIRAHYGLGQPPQTLAQIGAALGLTAERARQIEVGALDTMRQALVRPAPTIGGSFESPARSLTTLRDVHRSFISGDVDKG